MRAWSQACTGATITAGVAGNVYNCTTLNIAPGTYTFPANTDVVRVIVTGDVIIQKGVTLVLSGSPGIPSDGSAGDPGGVAGPGGTAGGDNPIFVGPQSAPGVGGGVEGFDSGSCGGGGGGGGFANVGTSGSNCSFANGGPGGAAYDLSILFRGGFGGGAGGNGDPVGDFETGTGGGGGGAIWISAGGNLTNNAVIDVRGGRGGNGVTNSGGGGGGSGGAVKLEAAGQLINNGRFLLSGGAGGTGETPGANGGAGSVGAFELIDVDNVIEGSGTGAIGLPSLNSAITCGSMKPKDDQNLFFQMFLGFGLVILISRIRGLYRHSA